MALTSLLIKIALYHDGKGLFFIGLSQIDISKHFKYYPNKAHCQFVQ